MKKLVVMLLLGGFAFLVVPTGIIPPVLGQVIVEVREADGNTPFDGRNVIVNTKLTLVVRSDSNDYFSGGLFIAGDDRTLGTLAGRGYDPNLRDCLGSHYPAAGDFAKVVDWKDSQIWGFDLYNFYPTGGQYYEEGNTVPGDWFVIDYYADQVGDCNVGFYDYNISWDEPIYYIHFSHVTTTDLYPDHIVNFRDFVIFTSCWNAADCGAPGWCDGADLNHDGVVDLDDLMIFTQYWLWSFEL